MCVVLFEPALELKKKAVMEFKDYFSSISRQ
jgi:hypothetical protein